MRRRITAVCAALLLASVAGAGPLDPDDKAKVAEIEAAVDDQLTAASDANAAMDELVAAAEFADEEIGVLLDYGAVMLRMDLERAMLRTCAATCSGKPVLPPTASPSSKCWKCANPRLMLKRSQGGLLEDVLALVIDDLKRVVDAGLDRDVERAAALLELAADAYAADQLEGAFSLACQSFGTLACDVSPTAHPEVEP